MKPNKDSHIEMTIIVDEYLGVEKVHWQWRGSFNKNGSSDAILKAYDDACDAYIETHT